MFEIQYINVWYTGGLKWKKLALSPRPVYCLTMAEHHISLNTISLNSISIPRAFGASVCPLFYFVNLYPTFSMGGMYIVN